MRKYFKKYNKENKGPASPSLGGYTIIETMISIALFLVVVMIGMNALLNANLVHRKSQDMRSILDNLSFIMEDMSRNLRTGYDYHCDILSSDPSDYGTPLSCPSGNKLIAFKSSSGDQWVYKIIGNNITRSINGVDIPLNSPDIIINTSSSGSSFIVTGAVPPNADFQQPFVIIRLVGKIIYKGIESPFSLQTSVSQRKLDNNIISP